MMRRPISIALSTACVAVIALLVAVVLKREADEPPVSAPPEQPASVTEPASEPPAAPERPGPHPPAVVVSRPAVRTSAEPDARKPSGEAALLDQLHELAGSNPPLSLKLAREAVARFPDSPNAPEFEWNVVKALFNLRQLDDAAAEARIMLSKYPDSYFTGDVVHHLLNHPPNPSDAQ